MRFGGRQVRGMGEAPPRRVVVLEQGDSSGSAEFDYLARLRRQEVGAAFAWPLAWGGVVAEGDWVLAIRSERVLVLRASLEAMAQALMAGAAAAFPHLLAETEGQEPVLTLRGFERREAQVLAAGPKAAAVALLGQVPVSLWQGSAWLAWEGQGAMGRPVVRVGLAHEFIDYYGETRADVLPFVPEGAREVLEIGCARGLTGALLQEKLGCRVTGVELNPEVAREAAGRLAEVVVGDVETLELSRQFDAVIALELFEHLRDPFGFCRKVQGWLRPGGVMILSTPNVGHWAVVQDLLEGRWDYLPIGLLCYTHLRFFTKKSLLDLLRMGGWEEVRLVPQRLPMPKGVAKRFAKFKPLDRESLETQGFWVIARRPLEE